MNKRQIGSEYEERAAKYLESLGYRVLEHSFRCRSGEIDLILRSPDGCICFTEVKYRSSDRYGDPASAVTPRKQRTICKVASFYLLMKGYPPQTPVRFDVVRILGDTPELIPDAFPYAI